MSALVRLTVGALALAIATAASAQAEAPASASAPVPVARDLREETQRIEVKVKDLYGREETKPVPITIFRPSGDGPFPLIIMNHGRATSDKRATQMRQRFEYLSRYLVSKGFVVLLPTRIGYAETYGDFDPEDTGACRVRRLQPMADAIYTEEMATLEFAKTLPYVDASRWIVAGQSAGGFTTIVTVGHRPPGLVGGINFAGGTGGNPENSPGRPCDPAGQGRYWKSLAADTVPMVWFYWQNDQFWGPDNPREWHAAWLEGGGRAELYSLPAVGKDGHGGSGLDMDHWVPLVDAYLTGLGFKKPGVIAKPAPSAFARIDEVTKVPGNASNKEEAYARFLEAPLPRAFAVGPRGEWGWAKGDWAMGKALGNCARRGEPCKLYAVDGDVVWAP